MEAQVEVDYAAAVRQLRADWVARFRFLGRAASALVTDPDRRQRLVSTARIFAVGAESASDAEIRREQRHYAAVSEQILSMLPTSGGA